MLWAQGGSRANIFSLGGSIFNGAAPALAQTDSECEGDVCFVVASRLSFANSKLVYEQAKAASDQCIIQAGGVALLDKVAAKLEQTVLGLTTTTALTQSESDFVTKLQACVGPATIPTTPLPGTSPAANTPASTTAEAKILGIPQTPFLIGAGALGLIGIIAAVARR